MNRIKRIRNLFITSLALFLLGNKSFKIIRGNNIAQEIVDSHKNSQNHIENIVAHRGFSGMYPENTLKSITEAMNLDCVDMIEIDIRYTKSGIFVLHHDSVIDFENIIMKIENLEIDDIDSEIIIKRYPHIMFNNFIHDDTLFLFKRYLNSISYEEKVITLNNVLRNYNFSKPLILDVKTNKIDIEMINQLNNLIKDYKDNIFIQSDYFPFLEIMIKLYPDYKYLYIIKSYNSIKNTNQNLYGYTVRYELLNRIKIDSTKAYFIYTINSSDRYLKILGNENYRNNMYIISDNPDYICSLGNTKKIRK